MNTLPPHPPQLLSPVSQVNPSLLTLSPTPPPPVPQETTTTHPNPQLPLLPPQSLKPSHLWVDDTKRRSALVNTDRSVASRRFRFHLLPLFSDFSQIPQHGWMVSPFSIREPRRENADREGGWEEGEDRVGLSGFGRWSIREGGLPGLKCSDKKGGWVEVGGSRGGREGVEAALGEQE